MKICVLLFNLDILQILFYRYILYCKSSSIQELGYYSWRICSLMFRHKFIYYFFIDLYNFDI